MLNFRTAVFSADKIRELATESNLYQTVSSIFISEVAKGVKDVEKKDEIIEKLDAAFSPIVLEGFSTDLVNQVFASMQDPNANPVFTIKYSSLQTDMINSIKADLDEETRELINIPQDKEVRVSDNSIVQGFSKVNTALIILAGICMFYLLIILLLSREPGSKLLWIGSALISAAILLFIFSAAFYILSQGVINNISLQVDERVIALIKKMLTLAVDEQKIYYIVEIIGSFLLGVILVVIGKATSKKPELNI